MRAFARRAARHRSFVAGAVLVALLLATALLSLVWTPWPAAEIDVARKLAPPSAAHWLGTDGLGRDIVSLLIVGSRTSIAVGLIAVGIGLGTGVGLGLVAAMRGGWLDELVMRTSDLVYAFPALLSAILLTAVWGPGAATAIVAIGIFNVPVFARVTRAAARGVRQRDFLLAARAAGQGPLAITFEHVIPNIAAALIVQATIQFAVAILAEAALSYLGLGTQPPVPSWGRMLNDGQNLMYQSALLTLWPGLAIVLSVLGLNLLGDGLRDLLDPRLLHGR